MTTEEINGYDEYPNYGNLVCEMCGSQVDMDTHICSGCKEAVEGEPEEEENEG